MNGLNHEGAEEDTDLLDEREERGLKASIKKLTRYFYKKASRAQQENPEITEKQTLLEYLNKGGNGPGKGPGHHTIVFKNGSPRIMGKIMHEVSLFYWQLHRDEIATFANGRKVKLNDLMTDEVIISTTGIGAER